MKKKDIKLFFKAIRHYDLNKVSKLLDTNENYLTACNFAPPKKDDGQSGLQVVFKIAAFDIAEHLIERGADVNFMEESEINEWRAPVLHDCLRATIFSIHPLHKESKNFNRAFSLLKLMLTKGADSNGIDSYGNNCLNRALLDAKQIVYHNHPGVIREIRQVFRALIDARADIHYSNDNRANVLQNIKDFGVEQYQFI